jgi:hypothetical protein
MSHFQINQPQTTRLLKAGSSPRLLTTRIIPAAAIMNSEPERNETADLRQQPLPADCATAISSNSKLKLATVRLLGKLKGGMPGEQYALPGECPKCRTLNSLRREEALCPHCHLPAQFDALIEGRKLSAAAWEKMRRALCLPTEIKNLSAEQARAILQLLDSFVDKFSFDEQESMTGEQIKTTLVKLPELPKLFSKSLKATTIRPDFTNAKRKPISTQKFTEVAAHQGSYCYWCGIKVIRESEIPKANRIVKNYATVVYLSADGEMREEAFGTIDHLVRVTDGGDNSLPNLVISCYSCNQEREKTTLVHNRPFAGRRLPCVKCGGRFFHPDWGCCSICGFAPQYSAKRIGGFSKLLKIIERVTKLLFQQV